ncbi:MAG TPA: PKD domain-containing protein, partial [Candidatus Thermoplasmatota archaeon]|nr:PKD domain-containing protein [Candidatus Thermoplasmatota archaeon]
MKAAAYLLATLALATALAGCSGSADDNDTDPTGTPTTSPTGPGTTPTAGTPPTAPGAPPTTGGNRAPSVTLVANVTTGPAPLNVTFTATAMDPDGDMLSFRIEFSDGTPSVNHTTLPTTFTHEFATPGEHMVRLVASDGRLASNATVSVSVQTPGIPPPFTASGTTDICDDAAKPCDEILVPFTVPLGVRSIQVDLSWDVGDMDLYVDDPKGANKATSGCFNGPVAVPGTPLTCIRAFDESATVDDPGPGQWTARLNPYQVANAHW